MLTDILYHDIGKDAVIVGEEEMVFRVARLLKINFGTDIRSVILTDVKKTDDDHIADYTKEISRLTSQVYISADQKEIEEIIRSSKAEWVIGSSFEKVFAEKRGIASFEISYPIYDQTILNKTIIGTVGEIGLMQEIISSIKKYERVQKESLAAGINENIDLTQEMLSNKTINCYQEPQFPACVSPAI